MKNTLLDGAWLLTLAFFALILSACNLIAVSDPSSVSDSTWFSKKASSDSNAKTIKPREPLIIGHRGASGYRPEHTLEAYQLAIEQGVDFIEPDLVMTKDGVLIARHENEISGTTDVAEKFPDRKTTKTIDGETVSGYFTEDFTLSEIKTLRAKERLSYRNQSFNGLYTIPTLREIIALAKSSSNKSGREIGIYPELKHPTYHGSIGLAMEPVLAKNLREAGWTEKDSPVIIQCFEISSLKEMRKLTNSRLVFLFGDPSRQPYDLKFSGVKKNYGDLLKPDELKAMSEFLYGIGAHKRMVLQWQNEPQTEGKEISPTPLVQLANTFGMKLHVYTFRSDDTETVSTFPNQPEKEYLAYFKNGIHGVFSDFPDHALRAKKDFLGRK